MWLTGYNSYNLNSNFEKVALATGITGGCYTVDNAPKQSCILLSTNNDQDDSFTQAIGDHLYVGNQIYIQGITIQCVYTFSNKVVYRIYRWWENCWSDWMVI